MGYYSTVRGSIEFDPPANYEEIEQVLHAWDDAGVYGSLELEVVTEETRVPEGLLHKKSAWRVEPSIEDSHKAYTLSQELQILVAKLPGRTFRGYFTREGEDTGDIERYIVVDGTVRTQKARFIFEEED